ncbi:chitinase-3-like protein 1 [Octopus sinensis]|uniref:Chitinase-3-like protein 1 n=1 Tax=Octopus sinensis TaxID=2607531 RepID=A0A6P7SS65_9MOLL|nr:chitinase-3-like protein 1 [Octopus sinensis]XP_036361928.1 chitinase-3-like protein 1 [Octopus sinensis]XP_036361929.1 chitinase-3-like protein 1 [Octopus sinensis]XP_036361930.1 chitinase-3-like protein 1 [Octopus sinensis]
MNSKMSPVLLFLFFCLTIHFTNGGKSKYISACYYTNWSPVKQEAKARLFPEDLPGNLCTHLVYAFVKIKDDLSIYTSEEKDLTGNYEKFNALKKQYNTVTLLSVGGEAAENRHFEMVSATVENRTKFTDNIITYVRRYNFDGIDIDWEYPNSFTRHNFTLLLKTLRDSIEKEVEKSKRNKLVLSAAVGVGKQRITNGYEVDKVSKYVDFLNVMAYDFHGSWNKITGFKSPLYARKNDLRYEKELSQEWSIEYWIKLGAPKNKLVLGMTAAGNTYTLKNATKHGLGAPVEKAGEKGPYTKQEGFLSYYEICNKLNKDNYTYEWDDIQTVPFAYKGDQWIGFDDYRSIQLKTKWLISQQLAGAMLWSLDLDDFSDMCGKGAFPLTKAIRYTLDHDVGLVTTTESPTTKRPKITTTAGATYVHMSYYLAAYILTAYIFYYNM